MTHQERLLYLAGLKMDCHHNKVQAWDTPEGISRCPDCDGTGKAPRFPMLRQKCPRCESYDCRGRGWLPTDDPPAIQAACHQEEVYLRFNPFANVWVVYSSGIRRGEELSIGPTLAEAAIQALYRKLNPCPPTPISNKGFSEEDERSSRDDDSKRDLW